MAVSYHLDLSLIMKYETRLAKGSCMGTHSGSAKERLTHSMLARLTRVSPRMGRIDLCAVIVAVVLAIMILVLMNQLLATHKESDETNAAFDTCQMATEQFQDTSDFLTEQARSYVNTGKYRHLESYLEEIKTRDRRGKAITSLSKHAKDDTVEALKSALAESDALAQVEYRAMRIAAEYYGLEELPNALADVELTQEEAALKGQEKFAYAYDLVYGEAYNQSKMAIHDHVQSCSKLLIDSLREELSQLEAVMDFLVQSMRACVIALLLVVVISMGATSYLLLWPMSMHAQSIRDDKPLVPSGARELRYLTDAYNDMYESIHQENESLQYEARYDALTGMLNRGAYDELLFVHRHDSALILVDIDNFKRFNDDFGHEMGDAVLVEVSATLYGSFRSTDHICRIGGDEFAVIATGFDPTFRDVIAQKIQNVAEFLRDTSNGLPAVTISVGVAFGRPGITQDGLFNEADGALYETKRRGRDGISFAE